MENLTVPESGLTTVSSSKVMDTIQKNDEGSASNEDQECIKISNLENIKFQWFKHSLHESFSPSEIFFTFYGNVDQVSTRSETQMIYIFLIYPVSWMKKQVTKYLSVKKFNKILRKARMNKKWNHTLRTKKWGLTLRKFSQCSFK